MVRRHPAFHGVGESFVSNAAVGSDRQFFAQARFDLLDLVGGQRRQRLARGTDRQAA